MTDEPARFLGLAASGPVGSQSLWLGTALAGPVPMVVALVVAGRRHVPARDVQDGSPSD